MAGRLAGLAFALYLVPPALAGAVAEPLEAQVTLTGVRCEAAVTLPCATLAHHLGLAPGDEVDAKALDLALRRLWASGLVDDVALELEPTTPGRALLAVTASERPLLEAIRLEQVDRLTRTRIESWLASRDASALLDRRADRPALEGLRRDLAQLLAAEGRQTAVSYRLRPITPLRVEAVFVLADLPRPPLVRAIIFAGVTAIEPARLRRLLPRNRIASPGARLGGRGRLDRAGLEADRAALEKAYRERGFKDVVVDAARIEASADGESVELVFAVSEGRPWRLGSLSIRGNRALGDQRLLAALDRADDVFSRPAIEGWLDAIRRLYQVRGRLDTRVSHRETERPGGRVDVVVEVDEGPELALGRLTVTGNARTSGIVLRRELAVDEGERLDLAAVESGLARIRARGLFEPASDPLALYRRDGSDHVDLTLSGRDGDPFRVDFGGGWSDADGLSGHFSLEARNLLGRGIAAGLRTTQGDFRDRLELYFVEPMFLGREQTLSGELFDRGRRLTPAPAQVEEREERGSRLAWTRPLGARQNLRLGLSRSRIEDRRAIDGVTAASPGGGFDRSTLTADWVLDRRDHPVRPSRGLHARVALALSSDHAVGGRQLVTPDARVSLYRPLGELVVVAARVAGGTVHTSGAAPAPSLDAVFLGGPQSVRGFATGSIVARDDRGSPLVDADGFRRGGDRWLEAGLEARFPLAGSLSGAVFLDAGQTWAKGQPLDRGRPRLAAGLELWLQPAWLPLPLRLTWAHNLDALPGEEFDRLLVGFGAAF